jgi:hypothetical protein
MVGIFFASVTVNSVKFSLPLGAFGGIVIREMAPNLPQGLFVLAQAVELSTEHRPNGLFTYFLFKILNSLGFLSNISLLNLNKLFTRWQCVLTSTV